MKYFINKKPFIIKTLNFIKSTSLNSINLNIKIISIEEIIYGLLIKSINKIIFIFIVNLNIQIIIIIIII